MERASLTIASVLLFFFTSLFAQNSHSESDPGTVAKPSTSPSEAGHRTYVSGFEILNGEKDGKDLGYYPSQILGKVRGKWYPKIPELQSLIGKKQGTTVIEFEINQDGSPGRMTTVESAGDPSLDAAAWQAMSSAAPFPRLPDAYQEKALTIRMHFGYDQPASPQAPFCDGPNWGAHPTGDSVLHQVGHGVTAPKAIYSPNPEYSEQARKAKYISAAWIAGTVDSQGAFTDLCLAQAAGSGLDEKAMEAVRTWKFEPATLQGQPVAVRIVVEVDFRLY